MNNLTILLRKANTTKECGNDVRELRCWGGFGKLCVPEPLTTTPAKRVNARNSVIK